MFTHAEEMQKRFFVHQVALKKQEDTKKLLDYLNQDEVMYKIFKTYVEDLMNEKYKYGFADGEKFKAREILDVLGVNDMIETHTHRVD